MVRRPKGWKAQVSNMENSWYYDTLHTCSNGQAPPGSDLTALAELTECHSYHTICPPLPAILDVPSTSICHSALEWELMVLIAN